jgi:hypothetical protein
MGNSTSKKHSKDITGKELKLGNRYRYYGRNGKLEKCRTLKKRNIMIKIL